MLGLLSSLKLLAVVSFEYRMIIGMQFLTMWIGILGLGLCIHRAIAKSSRKSCVRGWFVLGWMLLGWSLGGAWGLYIVESEDYPGEVEFGMAGFGLLIGWVVGMVQGSIAIRKIPDPDTPKAAVEKLFTTNPKYTAPFRTSPAVDSRTVLTAPTDLGYRTQPPSS